MWVHGNAERLSAKESRADLAHTTPGAQVPHNRRVEADRGDEGSGVQPREQVLKLFQQRQVRST